MAERYPEIVLASRFGLLVAAVWLVLFVHLWRRREDFHWVVHFSYLSVATALFGLSAWTLIPRRLDGAFIMIVSFGVALVLGPLVAVWLVWEFPKYIDSDVKP